MPPGLLGTPLASAHPDLPADPAAISQIRSAIDAWAGGPASSSSARRDPARAGVRRPQLHGPRTCRLPSRAGRRAAHFDLRNPAIDPLTVSLDSVTAIATHYTADLRDDDLAPMAAQLARVVDRVLALRGQSRSIWSAHSTAGLVAWLHGAAQPDYGCRRRHAGNAVRRKRAHAALQHRGCRRRAGDGHAASRGRSHAATPRDLASGGHAGWARAATCRLTTQA